MERRLGHACQLSHIGLVLLIMPVGIVEQDRQKSSQRKRPDIHPPLEAESLPILQPHTSLQLTNTLPDFIPWKRAL